MSPALCTTPIQARVMRVVLLDDCGVPLLGGGSSQVVTDGFVSIGVSSNYEDGDEFKLKKANGEFCVNQKGAPQLNWFELTIEMCTIDPDLVALLLGESVIVTGAPATGTGLWIGEGLIESRFSLEVWQPSAGAGACAPGGAQRYVYWAFPNVGNAKLGDLTFENGTFTLSATGETRAAAPEWGDGPGTGVAWIGPVPESKHLGMNISTIEPPVLTGCGAVAIT